MQKDTTVKRSRDADALRAALEREGCPVCSVILEDMQHLMDSWQYEGFTDVGYRQELIRLRGFCPLHTWQLAGLHTAFQLAVVYSEVLPDVLAALKRDLTRHKGQKRPSLWSRWWKKWKSRPVSTYAQPAFDDCPFCRSQAGIEAHLISTLLEQLQVEAIRTLLAQSSGLCLTHFTQARSEAESSHPEQLFVLLECQEMCMQRLVAEVQELLRKHDYRYADEERGDEMMAWWRAAKLCAGNPGVY